MKITDKQRLDWLARQKRAYGSYFGKGLLILADFPNQTRSVRKAIDAAIKAERKRGRKIK